MLLNNGLQQPVFNYRYYHIMFLLSLRINLFIHRIWITGLTGLITSYN